MVSLVRLMWSWFLWKALSTLDLGPSGWALGVGICNLTCSFLRDHFYEPSLARISAQRCQSRCFGPCGWMGSNVGFNSYEKDGHLVCGEWVIWGVDIWYVRGVGYIGILTPKFAQRCPKFQVCVMPKRYAERLVSFHQNCCTDIKAKRRSMMLLLNMTYDELRYEFERKEQNRSVFPDWVQWGTDTECNSVSCWGFLLF